MKIKKIGYLHPPADLINDSLDVLVTLEDNSFFFVEVTTPEFLRTRMEKLKSNFIPPEYPSIIVLELTKEIVRETIQEFIDEEADSYWLKLYHTTAIVTIEEINQILNRQKQEDTELDTNL